MARAYTYLCPVADPAPHDATAAVYRAATKVALGSIGATASLRVEQHTLLIVTCDKGHVCEYVRPDDAAQTDPPPPNAPVRMGRLLSEDEVEAWQALRDHVGPVKSVERSIAYAKWLFGGATTVALLAAGLATGGIPDLDAGQRKVFFVAELLLAIAMIAAAMCMAPKWVRYNPMSPDSVDTAFQGALDRQRRWLGTGAVFFALSLVAAAFVPVSRSAIAPVPRLSVSLTEGGALTVNAIASHLPRNARLEASIRGLAARPPGPTPAVDSMWSAAPFASAHADSTGSAELMLSVPAILWGYDSLEVVATARTADGAVLHRQEVGVGVQKLGRKNL